MAETGPDIAGGERVERVIGDAARKALRQQGSGDRSEPPAAKRVSGDEPAARPVMERLSVPGSRERQAPRQLQVRAIHSHRACAWRPERFRV